MSDPFEVVRQFEQDLCSYTGAPYAVTTTSCTMALLLSVSWCLKQRWQSYLDADLLATLIGKRMEVEIPKLTYVGVPMSIAHAGAKPVFRDEDWSGVYQLKPLPVWDSARRFTSGMYVPGQMQCVSFHWGKILGLQQGGAILHDDPQADEWLRRARFDGRAQRVAPKDDVFTDLGWHCYMSPEVAALGCVRLSLLLKHNPDLPNSDYPDLSKAPVFQ